MKNEESNAQAAVFKWAAMSTGKHPQLQWLFAVPNGGKRNIVTAAIMKREGSKRGVPDILLLHSSGQYHGLAIELKKDKGGTVSPEQKAWMRNLSAEGYLARVCKGSVAAIDTIRRYLTDPASIA